MRVPTRIPSTAQLRALESSWIEACHADWGLVLMEVAGRRAAEIALSMFEANPGPVTILCGRGNNGGDGLVVARYLHLYGIPVSVFLVGDGKQPKSRQESTVNREILQKLGLDVQDILPGDMEPLETSMSFSGLVVDALLGTGLDRPVEGVYHDVIKAINGSGKPVLAIDLPSGVNSDTGAVMGVAVRADATVTFGYLKAGLLCYPGAGLRGVVHVVDIGLPGIDNAMPKLDDKSEWWLTSAAYVRAVLPPRPEDSHKGTFGSVLSIAGSLGMSGASVLAAKSALRAGAGLSLLATPRSLVAQLPAQEVIYHPLSETASGGISIAAQAELDVHMDRSAALILGPGIGSHVETIEFVQQFLKKIKKPCVVDADALNAISQNSSCWPGESDHFVLTPHPKEASRLIGLSSDEIQSNRIAAAQKAAARFNCTVVLKGAHTVIAGADQRVYINPTGNSAMATAGAGDVLSGVIGGLLAQGVKPFDAAVAGAYLHGAAGDLAAQEIAMAGTIAGDIMTYVPVAMTKLRSGEWRGSNLELQLIGPRH